MEKLIDVFAQWSIEAQVTTIVGTICLVFLLLVNLLKTIRILLRGYPPSEIKECNDDRNLTRKCLKVGGCRTDIECNRMIINGD